MIKAIWQWIRQIVISQRLGLIVYGFMLLIFGKLTGNGQALPVGQGESYLTTVDVWVMLLLPAAGVGVLLVFYSKAIQQRKEANLLPESWRALFRTEELWAMVLGSTTGILEMTGHTLLGLDAGTQALAVNGLLALLIWLMWSYTQRPPKQVQSYQVMRIQQFSVNDWQRESPPK